MPVLVALACESLPDDRRAVERPPSPLPAGRAQVVRIDSLPPDGTPGDARSRLVFSSGAVAEIPIRDATLVASLPAPPEADWLLVSGVECSECDAPLMLWVFRAVPGTVTARGLHFSYPGVLFEPAATDPLPTFRSRLLVGACLNSGESVAVWLEETLRPGHTANRTVRILEAAPQLEVRTVPWTEALVQRMEAQVGSGRCREVAPRDQIIL